MWEGSQPISSLTSSLAPLIARSWPRLSRQLSRMTAMTCSAVGMTLVKLRGVEVPSMRNSSPA